MNTKVSFIKCSDYDTPVILEAVTRAIDAIGGIERFIKPGERILLKPNLLSAKAPERAITTHPEIVRAVARLVKKAGAVPLIGDSPGGAIKGVERVWRETRMKDIAQEEGVELVNFETSGAIEKAIPHPTIRSLHLSKVPFDVDGIINLPKLKTHSFIIYTGAVKNFYGCVPGLRKAEYHKLAPRPDDFAHMLSELYLLVKPKIRFTLIDGVIGMEGNGPSSGEIRKLNILIAGEDAVAVDTMATHFLGFAPEKLEMMRYLARKNAGETNRSKIEIVGDRSVLQPLADFKFPSNWYMNLVPRFMVRMLGKFVWMKPVIDSDRCENCLLCANSCPVNAITVTGTSMPLVSQNDCISCLCCHELCPYHAIELKSSFLARRLIRH